MLLNLRELKNKYNININHVLHIGAHHGDELYAYEELAIERVLLFEPVPTTFEILEKRVKNRRGTFPKEIMLANVALGNSTNDAVMHIENNNKGENKRYWNYKWRKFCPSLQCYV